MSKLPREEWIALRIDAHPGYISWDHFERNQERIEATAKAFGQDRRSSPPREGPALLQGLVLCGVCGERMSVRYRTRKGVLLPVYTCRSDFTNRAGVLCQQLHGEAIDAKFGQLLVERMTPLAIELSLAVQEDIRARADETDQLRKMHVEGAQYEVDLARQRYMQVDPARRMVADSLEADWNEKLRAMAEARDDYERACEKDKVRLGDEERVRILELARDFPAIWSSPSASHVERKRMAALLVEDVTLTRRDDRIKIAIRFRGGRTELVEVAAPIMYNDTRQTDASTVELVDKLLNEHPLNTVVGILNEQGIKTGAGDDFNLGSVQWIMHMAKLKSLRQRLLSQGLLTPSDVAAQLELSYGSVHTLLRKGELKGRRTHENGRWLIYPLDQQPSGTLAIAGNRTLGAVATPPAQDAV